MRREHLGRRSCGGLAVRSGRQRSMERMPLLLRTSAPSTQRLPESANCEAGSTDLRSSGAWPSASGLRRRRRLCSAVSVKQRGLLLPRIKVGLTADCFPRSLELLILTESGSRHQVVLGHNPSMDHLSPPQHLGRISSLSLSFSPAGSSSSKKELAKAIWQRAQWRCRLAAR
eukprot:scaffold2438_cov257-Pinguiococcus_pyrenoidosus.AAC.4